MSLYRAEQIINKNDAEALSIAVNEFAQCSGTHTRKDVLEAIVRSLARQVLTLGEEESKMELRVIGETIQRMAVLPGQRVLVLISPGFLTPELEYQYNDLIDRALRAQVIINTLDARGLYVIVPFGDASSSARVEASLAGQVESKTYMDMQSASLEGDVLLLLANGTGGTFFHNNNDMNEGFRRVADAPEYYYVLGFTPDDLKMTESSTR